MAFTTAQAAAALGVNVQRIRQLIAAGRLRAEKIGRDWMIEESQMDSYERGKAGRPPKSSPEPQD